MATVRATFQARRAIHSRAPIHLLKALFFGLLAAGLALGWTLIGPANANSGLVTGAAVSPSVASAPPATVTWREPAPDGGLIAVDRAVDSVRRFTGRDDLVLIGGLQQGLDPASSATYTFEPAVPGAVGSEAGAIRRADERYRVDARTGEVLEATQVERLTGAAAGASLSSLQAEQQADRFAADRFAGFSALSMIERSVVPAANGRPFYVYKWAQLAADSNAELPTSVTVSVSAASGQVVWYLAQREPAAVDTSPTVAREAAVATAAGMAGPASRWDAGAPSSVRLQVIHNDDNQQQLVWAVSFPGRADAPAPSRASLRVLIDAQAGGQVPAI